MTDLELSFHVEQLESPSLADRTIEIPIDEKSLPVDLRTDNITDYDKILNWSGSPDQVEEPVPLTGDTTLEGL